MGIETVVERYVAECRDRMASEMKWYTQSASLRAAIERAARSIRQDGKKHSHQRRIPPTTLAAMGEALQHKSQELAGARDFEQLHFIVAKTAQNVKGIGDLAIYDIAHRVGAKLGLHPNLVYLHRGTKIGASYLGIRGKKASPSDFPTIFTALSPAEIEDCLCVCKKEICGAKYSAKTIGLRVQAGLSTGARVL